MSNSISSEVSAYIRSSPHLNYSSEVDQTSKIGNVFMPPSKVSICCSKQKYTAKSDCHDTTPAHRVVHSKKDEQISTMVRHTTENIYVEL